MKFVGFFKRLLKAIKRDDTVTYGPDADKYYTDFRRNMCAKIQSHPHAKTRKQLD